MSKVLGKVAGTILTIHPMVKELISIKVVDVFSPKDSEQKGVTIRAVFHDKDKTLKGEFIKECEDKLLATLDKAGFPLKV